jgi:hypothetical protein
MKSDELIRIVRHEHANLAFTLGIYFGYPLCCNTQFCEEISQGKKPSVRNIDHNGFIPCDEHYMQIKRGEITLNSLIKDRICPSDFKRKKKK